MKHATQRALDGLADLLARIRACPGLRERSRGVFYRGATPFLHFHEDPAGLFADVKLDGAWSRLPVNRAQERAGLIRTVVAALNDPARRSRRSAAPRRG